MCWIFLLDLDGSSIWMIYILKFLDVFRDILPYIYIYIYHISDDQVSRFPTFFVFPTLGISSVFKMDRS
jgi:hypothetical protein